MALLAIVGVALSLTAVARAHTLTARAQTGADAAALAALDGAASSLTSSIHSSPYATSENSSPSDCVGAGREAAAHYAAANQTALDRCTVDGARATVEVHSLGTVEVASDEGSEDSTSVARSATAELVTVWKVGDRPQTPAPSPPLSVESLETEAAQSQVPMVANSGLLRLDPCGPNAGQPQGAGITARVRAALRSAEARLGQPVGFRAGWTEPCELAKRTAGRPVLFDQRSLIRVEEPSRLVTVIGPDVPLCQPYPAYPDHFALALEPVCGGRAGVAAQGFPNVDRIFETRRILVD